MPERKTKCPDRAGHCSHDLIEHTARGGCLHRGPRGQVCGCTYTTGAGQGASPFGSVGSFPAIAATPVTTVVAVSPKENAMPTHLFNIAGVATELSVTPQAASSWHRGPEKTPPPSFVVDATGVDLWTVDDIELWHQWVEAREAEKAAKSKKPEPVAESVEIPAEDLPEQMPKAKDQKGAA